MLEIICKINNLYLLLQKDKVKNYLGLLQIKKSFLRTILSNNKQIISPFYLAFNLKVKS
jgi:hypothetical protein